MMLKLSVGNMLENLNKYKVVLASNSPRRKELLSGLGIDYEVKTLPDIDESFPKGLSEVETATYIACAKADVYRGIMQSDELIITADTIVWLDGEVMGKPDDGEDAVACSACCLEKRIKLLRAFVLLQLMFRKHLQR